MYRTVQDLQSRLQEAEELLRAIRSGDVDSVVVAGPFGDQVYARHIRDLTERQRQQELAAAAYHSRLLENVDDAILATDDRFVLRAWNAAAEQIYGWKADQVLGRRVGDVIRADFTNAQRSAALKTLARTGHCVVEVAQYTRDDKRIWMEGRITALRDESGKLTGYVAAYREITERKRTDDLRRSEHAGTVMDVTERRTVDEERAGLLRQIVQAQEDERRRIALEMHDQFGQQLSALVLKLSALRRERGRRRVLGEELASLEAMTRQLDADLELIVSRLRPPALDDLGLVAALTNYMKRWSEHFGIQADIHASGVQPDRLSSDIDTTLYRVMQEALNNIAKHARAAHVAILLDWRPDRVSLIVEDDGAGFDLRQPVGPRQRFGVVGMRERATLVGGTLDIESHPGKGTTVVARIPLSSNPERKPT